jgi:hypothetical protein
MSISMYIQKIYTAKNMTPTIHARLSIWLRVWLFRGGKFFNVMEECILKFLFVYLDAYGVRGVVLLNMVLAHTFVVKKRVASPLGRQDKYFRLEYACIFGYGCRGLYAVLGKFVALRTARKEGAKSAKEKNKGRFHLFLLLGKVVIQK